MHQIRPAARKASAGLLRVDVSRRVKRPIVALAAAAVAAGLLFVALDSRAIYSPGAGHVARFLYAHFDALRGFETPVGFITIDAILRKIYALVAFALVGACVAPLFVARERGAGAALAVAQFSTVIEILQQMHGSRETLFSNVFDIASGAAGGWAGTAIYDAAVRTVRAIRARAGRSAAPPA